MDAMDAGQDSCPDTANDNPGSPKEKAAGNAMDSVHKTITQHHKDLGQHYSQNPVDKAKEK